VHSVDEARAANMLPQLDPTERLLMRSCPLCDVRLANCAMLPCSHNAACTECASHLKRCPQCKVVIRRRVKIFVS